MLLFQQGSACLQSVSNRVKSSSQNVILHLVLDWAFTLCLCASNAKEDTSQLSPPRTVLPQRSCSFADRQCDQLPAEGPQPSCICKAHWLARTSGHIPHLATLHCQGRLCCFIIMWQLNIIEVRQISWKVITLNQKETTKRRSWWFGAVW